MSHPKYRATQAMLLLSLLCFQANSFPCMAQSRAVSHRTSAPKARSSRPAKPSPSRTAQHRTTRTSSVQSASYDQHDATLAPTVVGSDQSPDVMGPYQEYLNSDDVTANQFGSAAMGCDACGELDQCCCRPTGYLFDWTRAELWAGTVGFTVPSNVLSTASNSTGSVEGSFGFQQGINFGTRLPSLLSGQLGSQVGVRFIQSLLDASAAGLDRRQQAFVTAGLFRRVDYGLQAGLVVDYLHEDWIYKADLLQLRGELSYLLTPCHEIGFRFTDSQRFDDATYQLPGSSTQRNIRLSSLNTYRGFYRFRFSECGRGQAELQAGWTENSGAILGLNLNTPLQNQVGLATNTTYLIPPSDANPGYASEGWNISLALVWTPGRNFGQARDYYRPLFDVADNGSFISIRD